MTAKTPAEIRAYRAENPKMRERDIAANLGISEAALVAAECGISAVRIDANPNRMLERAPELEAWQRPVQEFVASLDLAELRRNGVRLEDKDFIQALHWRGAEDIEEAERLVGEAQNAAQERGFEIHRGRMVLEIRPPIAFNKGVAVTRLVKQRGLRNAAYVGDEALDGDDVTLWYVAHVHFDQSFPYTAGPWVKVEGLG